MITILDQRLVQSSYKTYTVSTVLAENTDKIALMCKFFWYMYTEYFPGSHITFLKYLFIFKYR